MNKHCNNIKRVLDAASDIEINEGRLSYFRYNEVTKNFAAFYGFDHEKTVAVFAALSPNSSYSNNVRSLASVLHGYRDGASVEDVKVSTYNHCRNRAWTYLDGVKFLDVVKGKKIRSFYRNILDPLGTDVTIDGHAVNIWKRQKVTLRDVAARSFNYKRVSDDYRTVAVRVGLIPNQLQGITWFCWRRIHGIVDHKNQPSLFGADGDMFGTIVDPAECRPYSYY